MKMRYTGPIRELQGHIADTRPDNFKEGFVRASFEVSTGNCNGKLVKDDIFMPLTHFQRIPDMELKGAQSW